MGHKTFKGCGQGQAFQGRGQTGPQPGLERRTRTPHLTPCTQAHTRAMHTHSHTRPHPPLQSRAAQAHVLPRYIRPFLSCTSAPGGTMPDRRCHRPSSRTRRATSSRFRLCVFSSSRTAPGHQHGLPGRPSLGPGKGSESLDKTHPELRVRSNSGSPDAGHREALCSRLPAAGSKAHL